MTKSLAQLRDEMRARYQILEREAAKTTTDVDILDVDEPPAVDSIERAFTTDTNRGSVVITGPAFSIREQADQHRNPGFQYLQGRFVEADRPNRNNAMWSTADLQIGQPTIAGGPLNWLHQERHVIGTLLSAELVTAREEARDVPTKERKKLAGEGRAMKDGSFPIANEGDLRNAIRAVGRAKNPAAAKAHIKRRARALGLTNLIPDSWGKESAAEDIGNHITASAAVWRFIYPAESDFIERASANRELWYSMECISRHVQCVETAAAGCGETFEYQTYMKHRDDCCDHLRQGSATRRFIEPVFLGGAVITPPVRPGWGNANAEVAREAARVAEANDLADTLTRPEAEAMVSQVLDWAHSIS